MSGGQSEPTRQSDEILPPILGSVVAFPVTAAVLIVDLTSWAQTAVMPQKMVDGQDRPNPLNQYLTFVAGGPFNMAFAGTAAGLSALSVSAVSTVTQSGAAAFQIPSGNTANCGVLFPGSTFVQFRMPPGDRGTTTGTLVQHGFQSPARFMGLIAAANTTVFGWISSR